MGVGKYRQRVERELTELRQALASATRQVDALRAENAELRRQVGELSRVVEELRSAANRNSRNSSMPPSSDPPAAPAATTKAPTGRKCGGQPGHAKHVRPLVPAEQAKEILHYHPSSCRRCGFCLHGIEGSFERFQTTEIPEPRPEVTENRLYTVVCPRCDAKTAGPMPVEARQFLGPRALAVVALLSGVCRLSKRKVRQAMWDLFHVAMADGSVPACEQVVSRALATSVDEARAHVKEQPVKYADETPWPHGIKRAAAYLWTACTGLVTVFLVQRSRSAECARDLLGRALGFLVTDRYKGYDWWPLRRRQLCWAHIKRDIQAIIDAGGPAKSVGRRLERQRRRLFTWWHYARSGAISRESLRRHVARLRECFRSLLVAGSHCSHKPTAGTCKDLLRLEPALWTFVEHEGLEPTNNFSERSLRHGVLLRRVTYGTQSDAGALYTERILTVHATLRQQGRDVVEFLLSAITASFSKSQPPSLLPPTTPPQRAGATAMP